MNRPGYKLIVIPVPVRLLATLVSTALHAMQTRSSDEKAVRLSVRLSVCLSVKRVDCDKTEKRSVQVFILYEKAF